MRIELESLNGLCLNVEVEGSRPVPIIALHGFTGKASTWEALSGALRDEYTVIRPDLPGHGKSDAPDSPELYDMAHTMRVMEELVDRLGVSKAHWLGYSLGGRIALAAAVSLRGRSLSLTVESGSAGLYSVAERHARVEHDEALANRIEDEGIPAFVDYWESLPLWSSQSVLPYAVQEKLRAERRANSPLGLANSLRGIGAGAQPSFHERLSGLDIPCLFIAGGDDLKFAGIARLMHESTPGSRLSIVPGSGHAVHLEQSGLFHRTVLDFLRTVDNPRQIPQVRSGSRPNR